MQGINDTETAHMHQRHHKMRSRRDFFAGLYVRGAFDQGEALLVDGGHGWLSWHQQKTESTRRPRKRSRRRTRIWISSRMYEVVIRSLRRQMQLSLQVPAQAFWWLRWNLSRRRRSVDADQSRTWVAKEVSL